VPKTNRPFWIIQFLIGEACCKSKRRILRARARGSALPFCLSSFLMQIPVPGCASTHKFRNPDRQNDGYIGTDGPFARKIDDDGDTLE